MWYCEDSSSIETGDSDPNMFVYQKNGLFPVAYPPTHENLPQVLDYFSFMGIFLAKSLQDQRLVDMPFSYPFLKIICAFKEEPRGDANLDDLFGQKEATLDESDFSSTTNDAPKLDLDGILNLDDLCLIDPHRGGLLKQLRTILDEGRDDLEDDIYVELNGSKVSLEDLG